MNIKHIDIFSTKYVINIANELAKIINELNIKTEVYNRQITNDDIYLCEQDKNRYMFIFCPQWIYPTNINSLPKEKYFFYQLEQFDKSNSSHIYNPFVHLIMKHAKHIFDYSNVNLKYYNEKQINIPRNKTSLLIPPVVMINGNNQPKIIDILFCGCINNSKRRQFILNSLKMHEINVTIVENIFGNELTDLIKKSKIFLNIRYSDSIILETCRLHEAIMSTDTYIISEKAGSSLDLIDYYNGRIHFIDIIKNNTQQLVKMIKLILSLYNNKKPIKFNSLPVTENIKANLIKVFKTI
jgi:hypothetical protein